MGAECGRFRSIFGTPRRSRLGEEAVGDEAVLLVLADGNEHLIALDNELGAGDGLRAAAAGGVRLAELVVGKLDTGDMAVQPGDAAGGL